MKLSKALRLGAAPRLAFVGAGGKSTALFTLARELLDNTHQKVSTVIVTSTTHFGVDQTTLADHHKVIRSADDLSPLKGRMLPGVVLFTGGLSEPGRTCGLDFPLLSDVLALADRYNLPLLIEADGSRRRPLKAPADHEPAIPGWVEQVVVVAGMSAFGRPLAAEWVHRPEIVAELADLALSDRISDQHMANLLSHPMGGLKNIPKRARRALLLNQADTAEQQAAASRLGQRLLNSYDAVLVSSLAPGSVDESGLDIPDKTGGTKPIFAVHESVAGIVLAAGESARFGRPKQLLEIQGETFVHRTASIALEADLSPVVVVTGANAEMVQGVVADLAVEIICNSNWSEGQGTSVGVGIGALGYKPGAAVFLLADQPQVTSLLIRSLVELHSHTLAPITAPMVDGQRANPVLFDRVTFHDLAALSGDTGGRAVFSRFPVTRLVWHDRSALLDVDTPEDYRRWKEAYGEGQRDE